MQFTQISQFISKLSKWQVYKILVVCFAKVGVLLECHVISANQIANVISKAVFDNHFCRFGNIVVDTVIPFAKNIMHGSYLDNKELLGY